MLQHITTYYKTLQTSTKKKQSITSVLEHITTYYNKTEQNTTYYKHITSSYNTLQNIIENITKHVT